LFWVQPEMTNTAFHRKRDGIEVKMDIIRIVGPIKVVLFHVFIQIQNHSYDVLWLSIL
jgi:hypothetical protein